MKKQNNVIWTTLDRKSFSTKELASEHEVKLNSVEAFKIYLHPDLTEGRFGAQHKGYILIHAKHHHEWFVEEFMYRTYGTRITFIAGGYHSKAIIENWRIEKCSMKEVGKNTSIPIIEKLEETSVCPTLN